MQTQKLGRLALAAVLIACAGVALGLAFAGRSPPVPSIGTASAQASNPFEALRTQLSTAPAMRIWFRPATPAQRSPTGEPLPLPPPILSAHWLSRHAYLLTADSADNVVIDDLDGEGRLRYAFGPQTAFEVGDEPRRTSPLPAGSGEGFAAVWKTARSGFAGLPVGPTTLTQEGIYDPYASWNLPWYEVQMEEEGKSAYFGFNREGRWSTLVIRHGPALTWFKIEQVDWNPHIDPAFMNPLFDLSTSNAWRAERDRGLRR